MLQVPWVPLPEQAEPDGGGLGAQQLPICWTVRHWRDVECESPIMCRLEGACVGDDLARCGATLRVERRLAFWCAVGLQHLQAYAAPRQTPAKQTQR